MKMLDKQICEFKTTGYGEMPYALGRQLAIDFYDCDAERLIVPEFVEKAFIKAAKESGATIVTSSFHSFQPQGVSGVVVIAESHFAVHAWPEFNYAAVDIFTCGENVDLEKAIESLTASFLAGDVVVSADHQRGLMRRNGLTDGLPETADILESSPLVWRQQYKKMNPWGMQAAIDIYDCDPSMIRDAAYIKKFVSDLCNEIDMKPFGECHVVHFGDDDRVAGFSMMQLIQTSLLSGHFANATNTAYLDVFSCKYYDPRSVAEFATGYFKGAHYKLQLTFRQ
jgi:S-adenosylmethionine decarboxylase